MTETFNELSVISDSLNEDDRVVYLLASLPESYDIVMWSPTERREIKNYYYPSMFKLAGRQRLTAKKRNSNIGQFLTA